MTGAEFKQYILEQIQYQAEFRNQKAEEYPEDERNERSARSLRALAVRFAEIPGDYPPLTRLWKLWYGPRRESEPDPGEDGALEWSESEREVYRTYGFHEEEEGDPGKFLDRLVSEIETS